MGISPSYLNLIEHDKRRIGGKLLVDLARALGTEPVQISEGPGADLSAALARAATRAAARDRADAETGAAEAGDRAARPELDRIETLVARFPGWAALIAAQSRRLTALEARAEALRDRLGHDPVLAEGMHEVLGAAAAIRSTAAILAEGEGLDPQWRARFERNLNEEAERLSDRARALTRHFDAGVGAAGDPATPGEAVEAVFDRAGHHFPEIETGGAAAIPALLDGAPGLGSPAARAAVEAALRRYAEDAARLPLGPFARDAAEARFEPEALYAGAGGDAALVLRRLASLPPETGAPAFGLAVTDAAGGLLHRRRLGDASPPRFGAGCPLWPLHAAFSRPLEPARHATRMPSGEAYVCWSVAAPGGRLEATGTPLWRATMLTARSGSDPGGGSDPARPAPAAPGPEIPVGPGCAICPRTGCAARRDPAPGA